MPITTGAYLGGVRDLETLRERCVIDSDGCWHWRMPRTGRAAKRGVRHMVYMHGIGNMSLTRAAWMLSGRTLPSAGFKIVRACTSYDCANPDHLCVMSDADLYARTKKTLGPIWDANHRIETIKAAQRRGKLTPELARWARESRQSASHAAWGLIVPKSKIIAIRAGKAWIEV
jgi:hypothetical protein